MRFQRKVKLGKNAKLNVSKSGGSVTIGRPGFSLNLGPNGVFLNLGLPGTGVSHRHMLVDKKTVKGLFKKKE